MMNLSHNYVKGGYKGFNLDFLIDKRIIYDYSIE